jgi:hypothetical protein
MQRCAVFRWWWMVAAVAGCTSLAPTPPPVASGPPAAPPANAARIGPDALHALYATSHKEEGVVLQGAHAGAHWTKWTNPNGSMQLEAAHGVFTDTGHYALHGDMICQRWTVIESGKEGCDYLVQVGADEYVSYQADGSEGSRIKMMPP